ncbi:MAG: hypothetical protein JO347_11500, partial [Candidatus Eremiobacteraeota bacterium]|nr:hypothetical protein [Candidatus Eremiobacteraeota bacterium]
MKPERAAALRRMTYEQYLQTPEWELTRQAALKRAGRCQVCQSKEGLDVYHTSAQRFGCEQERDLISLCESCYTCMAEAVT